MAGFQFVSTQGTTVKTPEAGKADNLEVGDESKLPKPDSEPAELNLFDDTVKKPTVTPSEDAVFNDTAIAIATAADDLEVTFEGAERVAYAMEALRQVPVSHLNPSVIAMFETHLPRGTRRVARESAMTPVNMRRIALESGTGFFATIREGIRKVWEWIVARFNDFLDLFRGKQQKMDVVVKGVDDIIRDAANRQLPVVAVDEAMSKRSGSVVNTPQGLRMVFQPTSESAIFFKGFTAEGIKASIREVGAVIDSNYPLIDRAARAVSKADRLTKRFGEEKFKDYLGTLLQELTESLGSKPIAEGKELFSLDMFPKRYVGIIEEGSIAPKLLTERVDAEPPSTPLLLSLDESKAIDKLICELGGKSTNFFRKGEALVAYCQAEAEKALAELEREYADKDKAEPTNRESNAQALRSLRAGISALPRVLAHIFAGTTYHANYMFDAWLGMQTQAFNANSAKAAKESADLSPRRVGFAIV